MKSLGRLTSLCIVMLVLVSFNPARRLVKKAENRVEDGKLLDAKNYYLKALKKKPDYRKANLELGILLCELMDDYDGALPYLEKAYSIPSRDSSYDLLFAMAKCYHQNEDYEKALSFYNRLARVIDRDGEFDFQKELKKRKSDCHYAIKNRNNPMPENIYIVNAGKSINTNMPEYVPVITPQNQIIFTSRRKDSKKETVSHLDGKYFESMYIADIVSNGFSNLRRYTLPDVYIKPRFHRHHEAVISLSQDGKKLFTFLKGKIYEIQMDERENQKPQKLSVSEDFNYFQNSAWLTSDGKTLYFTADAKRGLGGTDIYIARKKDNGEWSDPENLGEPVNTPFDEDAPFISPDGNTLFFASKGHDGFGNYDMYKSKLVNGKWSKPENLGRPFNSPAHDIFLIHNNKGSNGFFSSGRKGGFGGMDIYKVVYLDKSDKSCPETPNNQIVLAINEDGEHKATATVSVPDSYKILDLQWELNGKSVSDREKSFGFEHGGNGKYTVSSKLIAWCDTCIDPVIACNNATREFRAEVPIAIAEPAVDPAPAVSTADLVKNLKGSLNGMQLASIGFDTTHILFDFDRSDLREEGIAVLDRNIEVLKKYPLLIFKINGYSDARGSEIHNIQLSARRAGSVKEYLLKNGVANVQIETTAGKGEERPVVDCGGNSDCDEEQHQKNRRVEFSVRMK